MNPQSRHLSSDYVSNAPFPHIAIENFLKADLAKEISDVFPTENDNIWHEYNNPIEKKFACDDIRKFPPQIARLIYFLNSKPFLNYLEELTGIHGLIADPYLHGGGLHLSKPGHKLDVHLDYSIHPKLQLERRINLIIYLAKEWKNEWNGGLELWNSENQKLTTLEKIIYPAFNKAAIFNTSDISFHGFPEELKCPEGITRNSIAMYYLTVPQENASPRPRALFVARPWEDYNEKLEEFRKRRSQVTNVY